MERLDRFMARANAAYYATHDPFRDFTTSPEITQVFGELLGAWAAVTWEAMGRPDPVLLTECGPGRGTLMADALRLVSRVMPAFRAAVEVHLIETSARLRTIQAEALPGSTWHETLDTLPPGPLILLGNEFLDALPIRQFVRRGALWSERHVQDGAFIELRADDPHLSAGDGEVAECCEPAQAIAASIARRLAAQGGAALFLDYGTSETAPGDSLQAIRNGEPADPLADPGQADLTAHVDFAALVRAATAAGVGVHGPIPQGMVLARLGLFQRSGALARTLAPTRASAMMQSAQRLAEPGHMGRLFKALCLCHPALPTPAGFEP